MEVNLAAAVSPHCEVDFGLVSECGPRRAENQDAAVAWHEAHAAVLVVADGMGGHRGGRAAAEIVVSRSLDCIRKQGTDGATPWREVLSHAIAAAHHEVLQAASATRAGGGERGLTGMGATAVLAVVELTATPILHVAHVGDSRAYLFRGTSLIRLTRDHSLVGRMVADGLLPEAEAFGHPDINVIERAIGQSAPLTAEIEPVLALMAGDLVLLTTDGLHGSLPDESIRRLLVDAGSAQAVCEQLVAAAIAADGQDNVTVGCMKVVELDESSRHPTRVEA
jgi:PPM family protein phosphatase